MARDLPKAPTVGHCICPNPHCGKTAAIRRNRSGKHYAVCQTCGPSYWLTPQGQEYFLNEGTIWGSAGAPADLPAWIREGKVAPRSPAAVQSQTAASDDAPLFLPAPRIAPKQEPPAGNAPAKVHDQPRAPMKPKPSPQPKDAPRPWWQF